MGELITSKNNDNIKYCMKLLKFSKNRNQNKNFVIEGLRLCLDAVKSNVKIIKAFYTKDFYEKFCDSANIIINYSDDSHMVDNKIISLISDTNSPQGIVCICEFISSDFGIDDMGDKILILDKIQNPSNLGAIIRTCDALKIDGLIISKDSCDIYNPKLLRSSMGSLFRLKFFVSDNLVNTIKQLSQIGFTTVAMVAQSDSVDIRNIDFSGKCAMIIGNEANGIQKEIEDICVYKSTIPINEETDSLNAAVAAGIAMWEIIR